MKKLINNTKKTRKYLIFQKFVDIILRQNLIKGEEMLKKLSLAALVAMGSMSFANATPLTEAIKNVNFGGYLRLRFYHQSDIDALNGTSTQNNTTKWRTTALFKFSVPVSEELKFNSAYAFDWNIGSSANTSGASQVNNVKLFLQYNKDNLTALVGKIPVPSPVTGSGVGEATAAGIIALYKVNDNITIAAAGLDDLLLTDQVGVGGNNTYAAAVLFKQDALSAQLWYFNVDNIVDSDIVARVDYKLNNIKLHADFATAELDDSLSTKTQNYFNVSATFTQDQICAKLGYAQTGKDGGTVVLDADSPIASVLPTEQKTGIANSTDTSAIYAKAGYNVDAKTNAFVAVSLINDDSSTDNDYNEYMVGVNYKYTKKMNVYAYYSILDASGNASDDNNEARVEFKYSF